MANKVKFNEIFDKKILKIELYNPKKNNAISLDMLDALIAKFSEKNLINNYNCILLTGYNNGPFSSGADLKDINDLIKNNNLGSYHRKLNVLIKLINKLDIPVISIIRSYCFGAGFILALSTDLIFASLNALFCLPASKLNIKIPEKQVLHLKKRTNINFLRDILLSSRKFSAYEAFTNNLLNACMEEKNLDNYVKNYLDQLINKDNYVLSYYLKLLKNL